MERQEQEPAKSKDGYEKAVDLLHRCATRHGFLASTLDEANYRRIWGRDGAIVGLAALLTGDEELIACTRRTLETLARHRGPRGEIPSNYDPTDGRISYGGTVGRVDADLWFVIACGEYWRRTGDEEFLHHMAEPLTGVRDLLGAWEFNNRGLLFVPPTGDWADEYLQSGYVLYDQLLYLAAQLSLLDLGDAHDGLAAAAAREKADHLRRMIRVNFWFEDDDEDDPAIYHRILYEKGRAAAPHRAGSYWMSFFSPFGYGYRFDALANILASLLGVSSEEQARRVDGFIDSDINEEQPLVLPAFWPVVTPLDKRWDELQATYSHTFKNSPYEFHNGGRWPMVTGFYVAALARRGLEQRARNYLAAIDEANATADRNGDWSFPEYLHGLDLTPGGTSPLCWSAAASVIGHAAVTGKPLLGGSCLPDWEPRKAPRPAPGG